MVVERAETPMVQTIELRLGQLAGAEVQHLEPMVMVEMRVP